MPATTEMTRVMVITDESSAADDAAKAPVSLGGDDECTPSSAAGGERRTPSAADKEKAKQFAAIAYCECDLAEVEADMSRMNHAVYKITSSMVRNKTKAYCGLCWCNVLFMLATGASGMMMLTPPGSFDWLVSGADLVTSWDVITNAQGRVDSLASAGNSGSTTLRKLDWSRGATFFEYSWADGGNSLADGTARCNRDVLTPDALQRMCRIEQRLFLAADGYEDRVCLLDASGGGCAPQAMSAPALFYGGLTNHSCELLDADEVAATAAAIFASVNSSVVGMLQYGFHLDAGALDAGFACRTRSYLKVLAIHPVRPLRRGRTSDRGRARFPRARAAKANPSF